MISLEIEVFKTGTWTDSSGKTRTWTKEDIDEIVRRYNEQKEHEAPVVIGHPENNAPAYGWVERLERRGKSLFAKIKPTVQEFVDWVRQGLYKKVSISLYPNMLLRHIGFLGATPPAVKGLKAPQFSEEDYIELMFREWTAEERERLAKGEIKGEFAGPNRTFPIASCEDVSDAWRLAGHAENPTEIRRNIIRIAKKYGWQDCLPESAKKWAKINMNEGGQEMEEKIKELEAQLKEKERLLAEFNEREKARMDEIETLRQAVAKLESEKIHKEYESFSEELIRQGKLTPAMKQRVIEFMDVLSKVGEYEFKEGKKLAVAEFKEWLKSMPKIVEFEEVAKKEKVVGHKEAEFKADGKVDEERMDLHRRALEYMEKYNVSYKQAMEIIIKEA